MCEDNRMTIFVNKSLVIDGVPSDVHLNDRSCFGRMVNVKSARWIRLSAPFSACGTILEVWWRSFSLWNFSALLWTYGKRKKKGIGTALDFGGMVKIASFRVMLVTLFCVYIVRGLVQRKFKSENSQFIVFELCYDNTCISCCVSCKDKTIQIHNNIQRGIKEKKKIQLYARQKLRR